MDAIAARVQYVRIVPREQDRKRPLKTILEALGAFAPSVQFRPHGNVTLLARPAIVRRHVVVEYTPIHRSGSDDDIRVIGFDGDVSALTATWRIPLLLGDG